MRKPLNKAQAIADAQERLERNPSDRSAARFLKRHRAR